MKRSKQIFEWAMEAETTAKTLMEAGETHHAQRFFEDRDAFLRDAAAMERRGM